jgi:hypothetical protein
LIEVIETGERVLIPYRWEQIGSKRVTSSRMQRRSEVDQLEGSNGWMSVAAVMSLSAHPGTNARPGASLINDRQMISQIGPCGRSGGCAGAFPAGRTE